MILTIVARNGHGAFLGVTMEKRYCVIITKARLEVGDEIAGAFEDGKPGTHLGRDLTQHRELSFEVVLTGSRREAGDRKLRDLRVLAEERAAEQELETHVPTH